EVHDFECIWSRAYDRLKFQGREQSLLDHAPVIQDESLRGTSSWSNALLGKDHAGTSSKRPTAIIQNNVSTESLNPECGVNVHGPCAPQAADSPVAAQSASV